MMKFRTLLLRCMVAVALAATSVHAQEGGAKSPAEAEAPVKKPPQNTKSVLLGASRASTAKAAEGAAKEKAKGEEKVEASNPEGDDAVTELRPLPPGEQGGKRDQTGAGKKKSKGGPLKDVHGSVYGGTGSAAQAAGGSAGASTRSGKTHVYVEGQSGQQGAPRR